MKETLDPKGQGTRRAMVQVNTVLGAAAKAGKATRCWKAKRARILMVPASREDGAERTRLSHEMDRIIARARHHGEALDPGLVRAKEAIDDEKNHLMIARSRWGDLLGSLSYTLPDAGTIRVDYIGMRIRGCGIGTRLMAAVADLALRGGMRIRLTAEMNAKGFFEKLGMEKLEEFPDGNCSFEFSHEGMRRLVERSGRSP
jgi:GNAT superfamily N-acetyltransferase